MNVRIFVLFSIMFVFFTSVTFVFAATPDDLRKAIENRARELQEINQRIRETQSHIEATEQKQQNLNREIQKFDYNISQLNLGVKSSEIQIEKLGLEIDALSYSISDYELEIEFKKQTVASFMRQLQSKANETGLVIFLKNQSLADSFFESQALQDLNERLSMEVDRLYVIKTALLADLDKTSAKKQATTKEIYALENKKAVIHDQKEDRKALLVTTKNQEELYQQQLSELEAQQQKIGAEIEDFERELREGFNEELLPTKVPGILGLPVPRPAYMTQEYGATSFAKRAYSTKFHNGIDLGAPIGTPLYAARDGKVVAVGNNGQYQYGRYIVIEHDNGLSSLYAHLSKQNVSQNQTVKRGDVIGAVGNTGYSFGAHVHFTLYWTPSFTLKNLPNCNCGLVPLGVTINPLDYLEII